ncbi:MAG: PIN domain-containing protein [Candidatus Dechloromonas phosphoritropha]
MASRVRRGRRVSARLPGRQRADRRCICRCRLVSGDIKPFAGQARVAKSGSERNRRALEIVPFDKKAVWAYGEIRADLEHLGQPIGSLDTVIAAHALSLNAMLVTNNTRKFSRVKGLPLENWVE